MSRQYSALTALVLASLLCFLLWKSLSWKSEADWVFYANFPGWYVGMSLYIVFGGSAHGGGHIFILFLGTALANALLYYSLIRVVAWADHQYIAKRD